MTCLLRIDASARREGSKSRKLGDEFEQLWLESHPGAAVIRRDLATDPLPHLEQAVIDAFQGQGRNGAAVHSDRVIDELRKADALLITTPLYNFGPPSTLKAWVDHLIRFGMTFETTGAGYRGLVNGKKAFAVVTRGGPAGRDDDDFLTPWLAESLRFIGITDVNLAVADAQAIGAMAPAGESRARSQMRQWLDRSAAPRWIGEFEARDRREIETLRKAQAEAILAGDAHAYARICADDVQLLIPGFDLVQGRDGLALFETKLFAGAKFTRFEKQPVKIERSGDLAVEVGTQTVEAQAPNEAAVHARRQKYTHVFRRTPLGWRFAALISNACP